MNTITIEKVEGYYTVRQGDRYADGLGWDEMLGTICELTHPSIGRARYRMATAEEWAQWHQRMKERGGNVVEPAPAVPRGYKVVDKDGGLWTFRHGRAECVSHAWTDDMAFRTYEDARLFVDQMSNAFRPFTIVEIAP